MTLVKLEQTCFACPSQWNAELPDGRPVYVRYRWGNLSIRVAPVGEDPVLGDEWYFGCHGDGLDGCMDESDMLVIAAGVQEP